MIQLSTNGGIFTEIKLDNRKKTIILAVCLVILLITAAALAAGVINMLSSDGGESVGYAEIPRLEGMTLSEAKNTLDALGIKYEIVPTGSKIPNRVESASAGGGKIKRDEVVRLCANEVGADRVVYLTFDDGPTRDNTIPILDMLDERGISASFFVLGNRIAEYWDRIEAIISRGHTLACHSYSHELDKIYSGVGEMVSEAERYESALSALLGESEAEALPRIFRFPGGSSQNGRLDKAEALEYIAALRARGYRIYDWTALTGDAEGKKDAESMLDYLKSTLARAKGRGEPLIILMHDKLTTREALPEILDYLISEGYYFDTVDNCPEYTFAEN